MLEAPLHLAGPPAGGRAAPHPARPPSPAAGRALPRWAHSVVSGAAAALSPKRPGRHPRLGTLSYRSRWVVVASAAWLAALRWPQDAYLLVPGALCWPPRPAPAAALGPPARPRPTPQEAAMPTSPARGANLQPQTGDRSAGRPQGRAAADRARAAAPSVRRPGQGPCNRPAGSIFRRHPNIHSHRLGPC
jgi:hypothetical protein